MSYIGIMEKGALRTPYRKELDNSALGFGVEGFRG